MSEKKKALGMDPLSAMMNPVATHGHGHGPMRGSIDGGRKGSIDGGHGTGETKSRRASMSEKKKGMDPLMAMMNPVATHGHGHGPKRGSMDGGERKQRRSSFAEREVTKCAMCKVENAIKGEKLCRLCK